jgi:hypothetical protein
VIPSISYALTRQLRGWQQYAAENAHVNSATPTRRTSRSK